MVAPSKFAHVVFSTHRFEEMIGWYMRVFEATVRHRDERLAFLSYDEEHHRMAFVNLGAGPATAGAPAGMAEPPAPGKVGVHHLAYTWNGVAELVDTYKRLKGYGIAPAWPVRHGMTLSLYYRDPDANMLEFQVDLLDADAATDFMQGPAFAANPIGEAFDPDELAARFDAGEPVDALVFRSDQPQAAGRTIVRHVPA